MTELIKDIILNQVNKRGYYMKRYVVQQMHADKGAGEWFFVGENDTFDECLLTCERERFFFKRDAFRIIEFKVDANGECMKHYYNVYGLDDLNELPDGL